ncbi:UNKNOWN [Stylonychia lemnae]|uniref:Uncharacterized protein n=1 Tax=Stylonychia lemnae TaxID=5949 RepID=A0A077ZV33_STYLE|nr:UNKNOWN [Stylonychia lemnae]|eukprot:CDW73744.1 UNKNOWN [Stylonychia lemnae]
MQMPSENDQYFLRLKKMENFVPQKRMFANNLHHKTSMHIIGSQAENNNNTTSLYPPSTSLNLERHKLPPKGNIRGREYSRNVINQINGQGNDFYKTEYQRTNEERQQLSQQQLYLTQQKQLSRANVRSQQQIRVEDQFLEHTPQQNRQQTQQILQLEQPQSYSANLYQGALNNLNQSGQNNNQQFQHLQFYQPMNHSIERPSNQDQQFQYTNEYSNQKDSPSAQAELINKQNISPNLNEANLYTKGNQEYQPSYTTPNNLASNQLFFKGRISNQTPTINRNSISPLNQIHVLSNLSVEEQRHQRRQHMLAQQHKILFQKQSNDHQNLETNSTLPNLYQSHLNISNNHSNLQKQLSGQNAQTQDYSPIPTNQKATQLTQQPNKRRSQPLGKIVTQIEMNHPETRAYLKEILDQQVREKQRLKTMQLMEQQQDIPIGFKFSSTIQPEQDNSYIMQQPTLLAQRNAMTLPPRHSQQKVLNSNLHSHNLKQQPQNYTINNSQIPTSMNTPRVSLPNALRNSYNGSLILDNSILHSNPNNYRNGFRFDSGQTSPDNLTLHNNSLLINDNNYQMMGSSNNNSNTLIRQEITSPQNAIYGQNANYISSIL